MRTGPVEHTLETFSTITLDEMDAVKLMDRTDVKFTFSAALLPILLDQLSVHYKVLQVRDRMVNTYNTLYFDTAALELYLKHHNGGMNRYKVRYRNYVDSGIGFLEVKLKNNKGRTLKERIKQKDAPLAWNGACIDFLRSKTPYDPLLLKPSVWVNYQRITLVGKQFNERVTIDINLEFHAGTLNRQLDNLVIAEVKQSSRTRTPVIEILKAMRIKEVALSKYCLGITQIYPHAKRNNFKEKLNAINKLNYDTSFNAAAGKR